MSDSRGTIGLDLELEGLILKRESLSVSEFDPGDDNIMLCSPMMTSGDLGGDCENLRIGNG